MNAQRQLSNVAKNYLCRFYEILDKMVCEMTNAELTDSISSNFINRMIPHHRAAIEMSQNILQYTTCVPLQRIAENIIEEQSLSAIMVTHNMKDAIRLGNRLIMMHEGKIIYDVSGEEKKKLQVSDLLEKFEQASGGEFANDRMMLA